MDNMPPVKATAAPSAPPPPPVPAAPVPSTSGQLPSQTEKLSSLFRFFLGKNILFIVVGLIVVVASLGLFMWGTSTLDSMEPVPPYSESQNVEQFALFPYRLALEFYYVEYQAYPVTLEELFIDDMVITEEDIAAIDNLIYEASEDRTEYILCSIPEMGDEPVCVTGGGEENIGSAILTE